MKSSSKCDTNLGSVFLTLALIAVLMGKIYYIFGTGEAGIPLVSQWVILARDGIVILTLISFGWLYKSKVEDLNKFWMVLFIGILISLIHLVFEKKFLVWGQHYIRNFLLPMLFFPVFFLAYAKKNRPKWAPICVVILLLTLGFSYIQQSQNPTIRPGGIFGDPLINGMIIFQFISVLAIQKKWKYAVAFVILYLGILQNIAPITAIISFLGAWIVQLFLWGRRRTKFIATSILTTLIFIVPFAFHYLALNINSASLQNTDSLKGKIFILYDNLFCESRWCHKKNWSLEGRLLSNRLPFTFCQRDITQCFLGNFKNPVYERIESNWASVLVNWGLIFSAAYHVFFILPVFFLRSLKSEIAQRSEIETLSFLYISSLFFGAMNVLVYRFPLNVILYLSSAGILFFYSSFKKASRFEVNL